MGDSHPAFVSGRYSPATLKQPYRIYSYQSYHNSHSQHHHINTPACPERSVNHLSIAHSHLHLSHLPHRPSHHPFFAIPAPRSARLPLCTRLCAPSHFVPLPRPRPYCRPPRPALHPSIGHRYLSISNTHLMQQMQRDPPSTITRDVAGLPASTGRPAGVAPGAAWSPRHSTA